MENKNSPEEKILDLIRNNGVEKKDFSNPNISIEESESKLKIKKDDVILPKKIDGGKTNVFMLLNRVLIVVILLALIYVVLSYVYPYKGKAIISKEDELNISSEGVGESLEQMQPATHYIDILSKRQMFKMFEVPKPKSAEPQKPKITLQQMLGGYTFIGILFGDNPQAVVEDKKTGQSFYLTAGQYLGEIKIDNIEKGKVSVSYDDQKMDINI